MQINRKDILKDAGKVSHELAEKEYDAYSKNSFKTPSKADKDFENFANKTIKLIGKSKKKK